MSVESYNETVFEIEGGRDEWTVCTGQMVWKNRLSKLAKEYPGEVEHLITNLDGSVVYYVPKAWVKISPPRKVNMTDEQKAVAAERLRKYREPKTES